MSAYYNENDPKAAAWLRELIKGGHIAPGDVDERSIEDVLPNDLRGYKQCHFFAGIGGWSYALRLAGVADDTAVWTGSCPCQPFSAAGKGAGFADERHLWPSLLWLIQQCRPYTVFGEQVANALPWIDVVQGDLEAQDYSFGYAVLGAHSVGAPHIRQRLYWVADSDLQYERSARYHKARATDLTWRRQVGGVGDSESSDGGLSVRGRGSQQDSSESFWSSATHNPCRDGKQRPIEPGTFPLAHGIPHRVGLLRGYGNAIVPQVAAAFIEAHGELA